MRVEASLLQLVILQWAVVAAMHSQEDALCVDLKAMGEGSRATVCAGLRATEAIPKQCSVLCGREDLPHISASDSARESASALPANGSHFAAGALLDFSEGIIFKRSFKEVLPMEELEKKVEVELVARRRLQASWATATCFNFAEFPFMVPLVRQNAFCACELLLQNVPSSLPLSPQLLLKHDYLDVRCLLFSGGPSFSGLKESVYIYVGVLL